MTNTHCPDCGASYALVGFRHRCVAKVSVKSTDESSANGIERATAKRVADGKPVERADEAKAGQDGDNRGRPSRAACTTKPSSTRVGSERPSSSGAYSKRNLETWRPYMREYMKAYRARKS